VTMELEREKTVHESGEETMGSSLKIFLVEGLTRRVVREVTWVFQEENAGDMGGSLCREAYRRGWRG